MGEQTSIYSSYTCLKQRKWYNFVRHFFKKKNVSDQKTDPDLTLNGFVCQLLTSSRDVSGKADWKIEKAVGEQEFIQRRLGKYPSKQHQQESL